MNMPGRKFSSASGYRYGFNGKENDKDISEGGQDYGMRIYDCRLGRFLSVDPLSAKYPYFTPYQFAGNNPLITVDVDGLEGDKDLNIVQAPLSCKDLPPVIVVGIKSSHKLTGWQKFKAFAGGVVKGVVTTVVIVAAVAVTVASAGAAGPLILAAAQVYGAYSVAKAGYEVISGKEAFTGRKLSEEERWDGGGQLLGGIGVGGVMKMTAKSGAKVTKGIVEEVPIESTPAESVKVMEEIPVSESAVIPEWKGPTDYSKIDVSKFKIGNSKNFTKAMKQAIYETNLKHNDGVLRSDLDGTVLEMPVKSTRGVTPSPNEAQVDHVEAKSNGGTNNPAENAQVLSRSQNRTKSNK